MDCAEGNQILSRYTNLLGVLKTCDVETDKENDEFGFLEPPIVASQWDEICLSLLEAYAYQICIVTLTGKSLTITDLLSQMRLTPCFQYLWTIPWRVLVVREGGEVFGVHIRAHRDPNGDTTKGDFTYIPRRVISLWSGRKIRSIRRRHRKWINIDEVLDNALTTD